MQDGGTDVSSEHWDGYGAGVNCMRAAGSRHGTDRSAASSCLLAYILFRNIGTRSRGTLALSARTEARNTGKPESASLPRSGAGTCACTERARLWLVSARGSQDAAPPMTPAVPRTCSVHAPTLQHPASAVSPWGQATGGSCPCPCCCPCRFCPCCCCCLCTCCYCPCRYCPRARYPRSPLRCMGQHTPRALSPAPCHTNHRLLRFQ